MPSSTEPAWDHWIGNHLKRVEDALKLTEIVHVRSHSRQRQNEDLGEDLCQGVNDPAFCRMDTLPVSPHLWRVVSPRMEFFLF